MRGREAYYRAVAGGLGGPNMVEEFVVMKDFCVVIGMQSVARPEDGRETAGTERSGESGGGEQVQWEVELHKPVSCHVKRCRLHGKGIRKRWVIDRAKVEHKYTQSYALKVFGLTPKYLQEHCLRPLHLPASLRFQISHLLVSRTCRLLL